MNTHDIEQERQKFEAFMREKNPSHDLEHEFGIYRFSPVQRHWDTWQAAIEAGRQARGEPIAWVKQDIAEKQFINMQPRRIWWECNEGIGIPIFTAPQPQQIPEGYKLVPDYKVGMRVKFKGAAYEIFAKGDRPGTFDICLPNEVSGDRWLNVPPDALEMLEAAPEPKDKP